MSSHTHAKRELRKAIEAELEPFGVVPVFRQLAGHHQIVVFTIGARTQCCCFSGSGNWRERYWVIANIRRLVREART